MHSMVTRIVFLTFTLLITTHALTTPAPLFGRYIILTGDTSQVCLNIAELEVYHPSGTNVARAFGVHVWQSDYWDNTTFPTTNLKDGDVNTFVHTSCRPGAQSGIPVFGNLTLPDIATPVANASFAWIAMDLQYDTLISSVVVQNRRDSCCTFRLGEGVHLLILNSLGQSIFVSPTLTSNLTQTFIAPPTNTPTNTPTTAPYHPTQAPTPSYPGYPTYPPTTTPTPSSIPDRGTFWPWSTPSGSLPSAKSTYSLNPSDYGVNHVIWQTDIVNQGTPPPVSVAFLNGVLQYAGSTSQHTYYYVTFNSYNDALSFWNYYMPQSTARAWVQYGTTIRQENINTNEATLLKLRYSYLWSENRIPYLSSANWQYSLYYVTARSRDGEFRMITYSSYAQAQQAFSSVVGEKVLPSWENQWTTVKLYVNGYSYLESSTCRGSELEHLGAFQWLEYRYYSPSSYYMLVSWRSRSGVRLERMQEYSDYQSATAAQAWVTWYSNTYDIISDRATSVIYYKKSAYSYGLYDWINIQLLIQHYSWLTSTSTTTPTPTSYPYGTPTPSYSQPTSTRWADLTTSQQKFIIAYPTALIAAAVVILLITGGCLKRHASPQATSTRTTISPCFRRLSCIVIFLCLASLTLLIISISMKNFNTVSVKYSGTYWAIYGPFHVFQADPYLAWLPVYWNAKVMGIVAGVAMIISMVASTTTIGIINNSWGTTSRTLFLSILALISSLVAAVVWIPVHIRVFDRNIEYAVLRGSSPSYPNGGMYYPNSDYTYNYSYYYEPLQQLVGTSYILLCVTVVIQLVNVIIMSCIKKRGTRAQPQADNDGLQLVQPTSPYYYRDVPAAVPVPAVPAPYIYGVPATAPPPFAFTHYQPQHSGPAYAAVYYPPPAAAAPVAEPLHQPILAAAAYPAQAAVPVPVPVAPGPPSAGYPTLPVEVPVSGPSTSYQRLL